jgi:uncharacterized protein (TIGR00255 family)
MLQSMTGFGRAKVETDQFILSVEIKTLNSKSADLSLRVPRRFSEKELELRNLVTQSLDRGKINFNIDFEGKKQGQGSKVQIDATLAKLYFLELKSITNGLAEVDDATLFSQALRLHGVIQEEKEEEELSEGEWLVLQKCVTDALTDCKRFRSDEGRVLQQTLKGYIDEIISLLERVKLQDPIRMEATRTRLRSHVEELSKSDTFDPNRFEQEMIYFIEKLDISEEKVRLANHLDYFLKTMALEEVPGRKLGFIGQEIGREINTIGSKANDSVIQKLVVEMKDHLEKIKEQSLNVL